MTVGPEAEGFLGQLRLFRASDVDLKRLLDREVGARKSPVTVRLAGDKHEIMALDPANLGCWARLERKRHP